MLCMPVGKSQQARSHQVAAQDFGNRLCHKKLEHTLNVALSDNALIFPFRSFCAIACKSTVQTIRLWCGTWITLVLLACSIVFLLGSPFVTRIVSICCFRVWLLGVILFWSAASLTVQQDCHPLLTSCLGLDSTSSEVRQLQPQWTYGTVISLHISHCT